MTAKFPVLNVAVTRRVDQITAFVEAQIELKPRPFKSGDMGYFGVAPIKVGGKKLEVKVMIGKSLADMRKSRKSAGKKK